MSFKVKSIVVTAEVVTAVESEYVVDASASEVLFQPLESSVPNPTVNPARIALSEEPLVSLLPTTVTTLEL
jgi:hypothetical protein